VGGDEQILVAHIEANDLAAAGRVAAALREELRCTVTLDTLRHRPPERAVDTRPEPVEEDHSRWMRPSPEPARTPRLTVPRPPSACRGDLVDRG